ncbi:MAG: inositol monophosphatase family protein [Longimicrobiales bacterium]
MHRALLDTAVAAARAAADVHRSAGRIGVDEWGEKGIFDFVSEVDEEAERCIVQLVQQRYPDHLFLTEEGTVGRARLRTVGGEPAAEWVWIIDPLDGTTNFLHHYPMHAASVAVAQHGTLVAGAVVASATGEEWTALRGGGAFRNGERIYVSAIGELRRALIGTGFPFRIPERIPEYLVQLERVLRSASGVRRAGSAALDLCHVATGWFDGFWELVLAPWDVAAGTLIVREAGGVVTTLGGQDDVLQGGSVLAGNSIIHERLGELVRQATAGPRSRQSNP